MRERIVVEWTYSPDDFFEEPLLLRVGQHEFRIADGRVTVNLSPSQYAGDATLQALDKELHNIFLGAEVQSHRPFELPQYPNAVYREHPDGRRDVTLHAKVAVAVAVAEGADLEITDSSGRVVYSSRRARLDEKVKWSTRVATHGASDTVAKALLDSYDQAVRNPDTELAHLYEIRDALAGEFGGKRVATRALGISGAAWKELGHLANVAPLKQGRHRGEHLGQLRDATLKELEEARRIARRMICAYLSYLESSHTTSSR